MVVSDNSNCLHVTVHWLLEKFPSLLFVHFALTNKMSRPYFGITLEAHSLRNVSIVLSRFYGSLVNLAKQVLKTYLQKPALKCPSMLRRSLQPRSLAKKMLKPRKTFGRHSYIHRIGRGHRLVMDRVF